MRKPTTASEQHWADLREALGMEASAMGGFGRVVLEIEFSRGVPVEARVRERYGKYRLGARQPPLGRAPAIAASEDADEAG